MIIARILGTVVSTQKDERLHGKKLLIVKPIDLDGTDQSGYLVSVDTVGAGDAFFAVSSLFAAADAAMEDIAFVGNAAGAMKVGIVGHRSSVERTAFIKYLTAILK